MKKYYNLIVAFLLGICSVEIVFKVTKVNPFAINDVSTYVACCFYALVGIFLAIKIRKTFGLDSKLKDSYYDLLKDFAFLFITIAPWLQFLGIVPNLVLLGAIIIFMFLNSPDTDILINDLYSSSQVADKEEILKIEINKNKSKLFHYILWAIVLIMAHNILYDFNKLTVPSSIAILGSTLGFISVFALSYIKKEIITMEKLSRLHV